MSLPSYEFLEKKRNVILDNSLNDGKHSEETASPFPDPHQLLRPGDHPVWSQKCIEVMEAGVTLTDPGNTLIEPEVEIEPDTVIFPGCVLRGKTHIGSHCEIGPHTTIIDSVIGQGSKVKSSCWIENMTIAAGTTIDPFQRLVGSKK